MTPVAVRGWKNGVKQFEERFDADTANLEEIARRHVLALCDAPHMIEFEFLEEPNQNKRFLRFGTDPSTMAKPMLLREEMLL